MSRVGGREWEHRTEGVRIPWAQRCREPCAGGVRREPCIGSARARRVEARGGRPRLHHWTSSLLADTPFTKRQRAGQIVPGGLERQDPPQYGSEVQRTCLGK